MRTSRWNRRPRNRSSRRSCWKDPEAPRRGWGAAGRAVDRHRRLLTLYPERARVVEERRRPVVPPFGLGSGCRQAHGQPPSGAELTGGVRRSDGVDRRGERVQGGLPGCRRAAPGRGRRRGQRRRVGQEPDRNRDVCVVRRVARRPQIRDLDRIGVTGERLHRRRSDRGAEAVAWSRLSRGDHERKHEPRRGEQRAGDSAAHVRPTTTSPTATPTPTPVASSRRSSR